MSQIKTSTLLSLGNVYSRADLRQRFQIMDATLNTGVFQPKGYGSIWLFVTEHKELGHTAYADLLSGDELQWDGQTQGRTDKLIIEHAQQGLELLLFYRRRKDEYPNYGFRYEGPFCYESHHGSRPAQFILRRMVDPLAQAVQEAAGAGAFNPADADDARRKTLAAIVRRQGQPAFRAALLAAYGGRCAITGCDAPQALEAAHIYPYRGTHTNDASNGLLLRSDVHTLFDLGLISIDPSTLRVLIAPELAGTVYAALGGVSLRLPPDAEKQPSRDALEWHWGHYFQGV